MFWISVYNTADIYFNQSVNSNNIIALLVTSVVCTVIAYFPKSYFETKAEKATEVASVATNVLQEVKEESEEGGVG